jgi:hypothetical protein
MCGSTQQHQQQQQQGAAHGTSFSDDAESGHLPRPPDPRELSRLISEDSFTHERYSGK